MPSPDDLLTALVYRLAQLLVASIDNAAGPIAEMEAQIPDRTARRMQRRALVQEAAHQLWESAGRDLLAGSLDDERIDHDGDIEALFPVFWFGVRAALDQQLAAGPQAVLEPLSWCRIGGSEQPELEIPPAPAGEPTSYVLASDPIAGELIYVCGDEPQTFGLSWARVGGSWRARNKLPLTLPSEPAQSFGGFFDPGREGIACWTLVDGAAFGVLVDASGANPIEQRGDIPAGPQICGFDFGAAFAHDAAREVTVCLGREAIYELDAGGSWTRVAALPEPLRPTTWFSGTHGGVFDPAGERVLFHWADWGDSRYRLLGWDGAEVTEVTTEGLPERAFIRHGGPFCAGRDGVTWVGGAGAVPHRLGERWEPVADGVAGDGPNQISEARGCADGDRFVLGPGAYDTEAGERRRWRVFFTYEDGRWSRAGQRRVGTASAASERLLAATDRGLWAVQRDWVTRHRPAANDRFETVASAAPGRPPLIALASDGSRLWGVGAGGAVFCWSDGGWQQRGEASPTFGDWNPIVGVEPGGRLVAWGGPAGRRRRDHTLVFEGGQWRFLSSAGSPAGDRPRTRVGHLMVRDPVLGGLVLVGDGGLSVLEGDSWRALSPDSRSPLHRSQRVVAHDAATGETLGIDLAERRVVRVDLAGDAVIADIAQAGGDVDLPSPDPSRRPLAADWVYDPGARELLLFVDDDLGEHLVLELGPVFEHAAGRGERATEAAPAPAVKRRRPKPPEPRAALEPVQWEHFGPARPAVAVAAPLRRERPDYVLAFDSTAGAITYVRGRSRSLGETWRSDGESWCCVHAEAVDTPSTGQRFRAVDDPSRGGLVCWTTDSPRRSERTALGVVVGDRVALLETRGEAPALSEGEQRDLDHRVLFVFDPLRGVTAAFTSRGLWELDPEGIWSRRASWDGDNPMSGRWRRPGFADAGWDAIGQRIVAWYYGDDKRLHTVAIAEDGPVELDGAALPEAAFARGSAPIIGAAADLGILFHAGPELGTFSLGPGGWEPLDRDPAAPPRARDCQLARDPGRDLLMLGPGDYAAADDLCHPQHVFFCRQAGRWSMHGALQPERERPFHIEPFAVCGDQMLGLNRSGQLFVWSDDEAWIAAPDPGWTAWSEQIAAGYRDREGRFAVVTTAGNVFRLIDGTWTARDLDTAAFGEAGRFGVEAAYDPDRDRWLAYHLEPHNDRSDTFVLEGDSWTLVDAEAPPEGRGAYTVAYDGYWGRFVRVHPSQIAVLDGGSWRPITASPAAAGVRAYRLRALHDPATGETLLIDFEQGGLYRLDRDAVTYLTSYQRPADFVDPDPGSSFPSFPFTWRCAYDPDRRQLLDFDPGDHYGNYRLDLGPVFDAASRLGPRARL